MIHTIQEKIQATRKFWGSKYQGFHFITDKQARVANARREKLLDAIRSRVNHAFQDSKLHTGALSKGCQLCGQGRWSCLFINFTCNADCFFCPGSGYKQGTGSLTNADGVSFDSSRDYADYVRRFDIRAVSFSGGDPLLTFDRFMDYLTRLREDFGNRIYIWLYTNGLAATEENLERLRDAGLDEIRFNIAATNYQLDKVKMATRIMDKVTVEIPMIPEDRNLVKQRLVEMSRIGVDYLHLHQLMVIGTNHEALRARGYVLSHGLTPPVVDSELMALDLMAFALDEKLDLPVQYCSWVYKSRWHVRSQNTRLNARTMRGFESETQGGLVRRIWIEAASKGLPCISEEFEKRDPGGDFWLFNREEDRIYCHHSLLSSVEASQYRISLAYFRPVLEKQEQVKDGSSLNYREVKVNDHKTVRIVLHQISDPMILSFRDALDLETIYMRHESAGSRSGIPGLEKFESIGYGLPDYV